MQKRFFTVQEANELIPFLTKRLEPIRCTYVELKTTGATRTRGSSWRTLEGVKAL